MTRVMLIVGLSLICCLGFANPELETSEDIYHLIKSKKEISCEALANSFCDEMWSKQNRGNLTYFDDQFEMGKSTYSKMTLSQRYYFQDLANALEYLPSKFAKYLRDPVANLQKVLLDESDRIAWAQRVNRVLFEVDQANEAYLYDILYTDHPDLKEKRLDDYTPDDDLLIRKYKWQVNRELVDALFDHDQKWMKAQLLFRQVQNDLTAEISQLPLPNDLIAYMIGRVQSIEMSRPYSDPHLLGVSEDCSKMEVNASYSSQWHKFTVCKGYLNTLRSESNIYLVMAHELSHSIDPKIILEDFFKGTPVAQLFTQVASTNGNLPCGKWRDLKSRVDKDKSMPFKLPTNFVNLTNCLVDRSELRQADANAIQNVVQTMTSGQVAAYANSDTFLRLVNPETIRYGIVEKNPIYMNPLLNDSLKNDIDMYADGFPYLSPLFVQEYACQISEQGQPVNQMELLPQVMVNMSKVLNTYFERHFSALGYEDSFMTRYQLAKTSSEDFADWMAQRIFAKYIGRSKTLEERRRRVASSFAIFCESKDMAKLAPEVALYLQKFKTTVHPIYRQRRLRIYTQAVADEVQCTRGNEVQKMANSCEMNEDSSTNLDSVANRSY